MGVREIGGEEVRERTGIGMHHGREPPILGREDLPDRRAIRLCPAEMWQQRARCYKQRRATGHAIMRRSVHHRMGAWPRAPPCPVRKPASSLHSNAQTVAMSTGVPSLRMGDQLHVLVRRHLKTS